MERDGKTVYGVVFFVSLPPRWTSEPEQWPPSQRQAAARNLAHFLATEPFADELREAVRFMASDADPTVRREIAELLPLLPDDLFAELAGLLGSDRNSYVRAAAARAAERRGKGSRKSVRLRREVLEIRERFVGFEAEYGARASCRARRMANELFEALVGATLHDFIGFLPAMRLDLETLQRHFDSGQPGTAQCKAKLDKISRQLDHLKGFIDDMRLYAKAKPKNRTYVWVVKILEDAVGLAREGAGAPDDLEVVVDAPADLRAPVYEAMAVAAVMHLVRNAIEALIESPATRCRKVVVQARKNTQGDLVVKVADSGPGIDPRTLDDLRMFVPGKTTKSQRGTGFGLPTAQRYAEAHGGGLVIESSPGHGSTFTLTLPAMREDDE